MVASSVSRLDMTSINKAALNPISMSDPSYWHLRVSFASLEKSQKSTSSKKQPYQRVSHTNKQTNKAIQHRFNTNYIFYTQYGSRKNPIFTFNTCGQMSDFCGSAYLPRKCAAHNMPALMPGPIQGPPPDKSFPWMLGKQ